MAKRLQRSIKEPIRIGLSWHEKWTGPDDGLIFCWERGRQERDERPEHAARAQRGELVPLDWKGGVHKKLKSKYARGTLKYLATWQGIRGEDLSLDLEGETVVTCSKFEQAVVFSSKPIEEPEEN